MKKLNEQEMAKVSGGAHSSISREEIERHKGSPVGKYDAIEGNIYITEDSNYMIVVGKLIRSFEDDGVYGSTKRNHEMQIIDFSLGNENDKHYNSYEVGKTVRFNGDSFQLYEYID